MSAQQRCILSKFYIKPQLRCILGYTALGCILSKFYIKPQQLREAHWELFRCILSKFYIKPQLRFTLFFQFIVVSYRNSTSNHNFTPRVDYSQGVVSYRNSTSNHNSLIGRRRFPFVVSYRNSTSNHNQGGAIAFNDRVVSYRNSTSNHNNDAVSMSGVSLYLIEILHQTTTIYGNIFIRNLLYLIEILHQTTTSGLILIDKVLLTGCLPL